MKLIGDESNRRDLKRRREIKYAFFAADKVKLRNLLDGSCRRIIYNKKVSAVRSIYFDTSLLNACRDNIDGIGNRKKVLQALY